ncbi:MAG: NAD(P)H-dependent oxidoreductase subunit E, partial [Clostridia bacterium]|nr:NAD(P)H-dependent oxidoreductase subunit E [Clostridia bacterium]
MKIRDSKEFMAFAQGFSDSLDKQKTKVLVCAGTGCVAGGSLDIYQKLRSMVEQRNLLIDLELETEKEGIGVKKSGCHGFCEMGPLVKIEPYNYLYVRVSLEDCEEIVKTTLIEGKPVERLLYSFEGKTYPTQEEIPFYKKQTRLVLDHCGTIDAESIREYMAKGGYETFVSMLSDKTPEEVCKIVSDSSLRGRGGGGYPAGRKWQQVLSQPSEVKYVVCNGDEGDPGAFMDRSVMEGDPHRVLEGMLIA